VLGYGDWDLKVLTDDIYSDDVSFYTRAPNFSDSMFVKQDLVQ